MRIPNLFRELGPAFKLPPFVQTIDLKASCGPDIIPKATNDVYTVQYVSQILSADGREGKSEQKSLFGSRKNLMK
jgi:hypothetical protein